MPSMTYRHILVKDQGARVAEITPMPDSLPPRWAAAVQPPPATWGPGPDAPLFAPPIPFVVPPADRYGECFYPHNHCPSIAWLPNGDMLAVWFSTIREEGVEMTILASRLRAGSTSWDPAAEFFNAENRNMTGSSIFYDEATGVLHHINGMGLRDTEGWGDLVMVHRYSQDNGVSWSAACPVSAGGRYQRRNQPIAGMVRTRDGALIQLCDATDGGTGNSAVHLSRDSGRTWHELGSDIRGIHAAAAALADGRWLAFGRGREIDGRMPMSVSADRGTTWQYAASEFPGIGAAQRLVLLRLREGPLLLVSFSGPGDGAQGIMCCDLDGRAFNGVGMFAALSYDEGETWAARKLLTPGDGAFETGPYFGAKVRRPPVVRTTPTQAEMEGYLAATQTPDGVIHLISSRLYYRFNLAWLADGS